MIKYDFDDFFNIVVKQCIDTILENVQKDECSYIGDKCKYGLYRNYQEKRDFVKNKYMKKTDEPALDRHKVASCMMYAILKVKPIKINRYKTDLPEKLLLANEYLAFFVALNIIEMYRKDQLEQQIRENKIERGQRNRYMDNQIVLPKTYHENGENGSDFLSNTCKALYYIELQGINKFDIFAYSSILFLLEKYTDMVETK